jgi:hypothetical protein
MTVATGPEQPVAVVVDERLRGDEGKQGGGHDVHARTPLFRDVIRVMTVNKRDYVSLMLNEQ